MLEKSENAERVFLKCKMTSPPGFITLTNSKINVLSYMPEESAVTFEKLKSENVIFA